MLLPWHHRCIHVQDPSPKPASQPISQSLLHPQTNNNNSIIISSSMCDSSSSSSSSEDDLLQSPIFTKTIKTSSRRIVDRAEKNKLDFFDACLKGSDARTDVHRRIAEMDVELFGLSKVVKEEQQDDNDNDEHCGGGSKRGDGKEEEDTKKKINDDSDSDDDDDDDDNLLLSDLGRIAEKIEAEKQKEIMQRKINEDDYWAKIDSFAEKNASKSPKSRSKDSHSSRRRLSDAVSGLEYSSDLSDEEEGYDDDTSCNMKNGMTRQQMRSEAEAKSQGSYSHLGLRRMFFHHYPPMLDAGVNTTTICQAGAKRSTSRIEMMFVTRQEAMDKFKSIVMLLHKTYNDPKSRSEEAMLKLFVHPLLQIIKSPAPSFWDKLYFLLVKNPILSGKYAVHLPSSFCEWMVRLACSSFHVGKHCSNVCCNLIRKYLVMQADVSPSKIIDGTSSCPSFRADLAFLLNYSMNDLVSTLVDDFGLWTKHGPIPSSSAVVAREQQTTENSNDCANQHENPSTTPNVHAMKNTMLIWKALFDRNFIRLQPNDGDGTIVFGADASRVLNSLLRVGMDPSFNNDNTCGESLLSLIQQVSTSLIKTTAHQIKYMRQEADGGLHILEQWIHYTADAMVDASSDLLAGENGTADCDDIRGYLALAMAVKRMSPYDVEFGYNIDFAKLKMMFAVRALHKCLIEVTGWDDRVKKRIDDLSEDFSVSLGPSESPLCLAMHGLVTAEMGLHWMDEESESFMLNNHPRVLAAIFIAGECALVGIGLFRWTRNLYDGIKTEDESSRHHNHDIIEEQDAIHEIVSNIEYLCDSLKKECRAVIAYPHLRRTKDFLTRLSKQLGATKGKSSRDKRKKIREQGSLDTYFSRPSLSQSVTTDPESGRDSQDS